MFANNLPQCPRCKQHAIVQRSEHRWSCLNCNFSRDFSASQFNALDAIFGLILAVIVIFFIAEIVGEREAKWGQNRDRTGSSILNFEF